MRILFKSKDGGLESTVTGYWLIECKSLFSIVLLKFNGVSREAYHSHAFNSISWLLSGMLLEKFKDNKDSNLYYSRLKPIITKREDFHKVHSAGISWVLSFRGTWSDTWEEHTDIEDTYTLSDGRIKIWK